jgi:hypothetical protein
MPTSIHFPIFMFIAIIHIATKKKRECFNTLDSGETRHLCLNQSEIEELETVY